MHNKKRIIITGATGFTGRYVVREFAKHFDSYEISVFARSKEKCERLGFKSQGVREFIGAFEDQKSFIKALKHNDILVNIASLGFGHAPLIIDACLKCGIKRALFISTTSIFTKLNPASKLVRMQAEELIRKSDLEFTILRPTMIFGTTDDRNISRLIRLCKRIPIIFVPGPGVFKLQPIYVKDLACAILQALCSNKTGRGEYNVAGKDPISFNELVSHIASLLKKKIFIVHLPMQACMRPMQIAEKLGIRLPIRSEQIMRINEDKAFSNTKAIADFDYTPSPLAQCLRSEIDEICFKG